MSNRGFASMDPEKQHEIASKGGQARGRQLHEQAEQRKQSGGRMEGEAVENKSSGGQGFASMDPEKQHEIASKGGKARGKQLHEQAEQRKKSETGEYEGQKEYSEKEGEFYSEETKTRSGGGGQGFASMDPEKQREIASKGGKARAEQRRQT